MSPGSQKIMLLFWRLSFYLQKQFSCDGKWHSLFYPSNLHLWPMLSRVRQLHSELLAMHKTAAETGKSGKQSEWSGAGSEHPGAVSRKMHMKDK